MDDCRSHARRKKQREKYRSYFEPDEDFQDENDIRCGSESSCDWPLVLERSSSEGPETSHVPPEENVEGGRDDIPFCSAHERDGDQPWTSELCLIEDAETAHIDYHEETSNESHMRLLINTLLKELPETILYSEIALKSLLVNWWLAFLCTGLVLMAVVSRVRLWTVHILFLP
ncbi:hypothetical protein HOLleu_35842 [Holothuria leucospilota]|uniref:Uncharacterized protein n=1 Tax=Holothuria leucospilota TaxID=206669 RepID=A0A9Q1BFB9_HOLLE|nr:hypothetical protein HOLleu_35842 [Holothuria leucospilota]